MKNKPLFSAVLLLIFLSCQNSEMVQTDGALRTTDASGILPLGGNAHKYSFDSSVVLLSNLAARAPLSQISSSFGWGGSFPVSAFRVASANQGVLLWYCFRGGNEPQMFLALEHLRDYDPANLPRQPISQELAGPTHIFNNPLGRQAGESSIREFLRTQSGDQPGWVTLASGQVAKYIASADSVFRKYPDENGEKYNNYMFGFFSVRHEAGFDAFLDRAGENGYIRYYFGYDEKDKPNRIRIILMAVDAKGVNKSYGRTADDGGSMQKSWPPPPDN